MNRSIWWPSRYCLWFQMTRSFVCYPCFFSILAICIEMDEYGNLTNWRIIEINRIPVSIASITGGTKWMKATAWSSQYRYIKMCTRRLRFNRSECLIKLELQKKEKNCDVHRSNIVDRRLTVIMFCCFINKIECKKPIFVCIWKII